MRLAVVILAAGCSQPAANSVPPDAHAVADGHTVPPDAGPLALDCVANDPACPALAIAGDPAAGGVFSGFADPTMRLDPATGRLWLAYSWARTTPASGLDIHLAHSDDSGASWAFDTALWPAKTVTSPITNKVNYTSNEVANLARDASGRWYAIRDTYLVDPDKGQYDQIGTDVFTVTAADSPLDLGSGEEATLGSGLTSPQMHATLDLTSLDPALQHCGLFNEPALVASNGMLYLLAQCISTAGATADFYAVLSTAPAGPPATWTWHYAGQLAGHAEAVELENHQAWVQLDVATALDGSPIVMLSPADIVDGTQIQYGCHVLELASLDPPMLARDAAGHLIERAEITASDLLPPANDGPGACTYDPASVTGMLFVRRLITGVALGTWSIQVTGVRP